MNAEPTNYRFWQVMAIAGVLLTATAAVALGLDGIFDLDIGNGLIDAIGWAIPGGIVLAAVGIIGWAKHRGRTGRYSLGWGLLVAAFAAIGIGYVIDGMDVHGSAGPVLLISFPTAVLAIVLFIMGGVSKRD
jgi:hypothetical protein